MAARRQVASAVLLASVALLGCGVAFAAKGYPDRVGDVGSGAGPDIAAVTVSNTATKVTFRIRFVQAPPLRIDRSQRWIDMLLVGIDVPPLGPRPIAPGGEWAGADFAVGTHGPSTTGRMVRLGEDIPAGSRQVARFPIVTDHSTLTFSIRRRALGNPAWFTFSVAAARERQTDGAGGAFDTAPGRGTHRYALTG